MTDSPTKTQQSLEGPDPTQVRFLTSDMCRIHLGSHGALHVTVKGERIYGGVYAAYAFPVAHPDGYVALIHSVGKGRDIEIGIIRDLNQFPKDDGDLVRQALARRYFVHNITKLKSIGWKYGFIAIEAETDKGPVDFLMRWQYDRAVDYGQHGKILIDVDENRYLIPDMRQLPARELADLQRYIYW